jgi:hypothetical protein
MSKEPFTEWEEKQLQTEAKEILLALHEKLRKKYAGTYLTPTAIEEINKDLAEWVKPHSERMDVILAGYDGTTGNYVFDYRIRR